MTRQDKEDYVREYGVEPCFRAWGGEGLSHVCFLPKGHKGACRCGACESHPKQPQEAAAK